MPDQLTSCSQILAATEAHICGTLTFPSYCSLPIPTVRRGRLCAAALVGRGEYAEPPLGFQIWDPHLLAVFNAVDCSLEELRGIGEKPSESAKPTGAGVAPLDLLEGPLMEARIKYCELADTVMMAVNKRADTSRLQDELYARFVPCVGEVLSRYWKTIFLREIAP